MPSRDECIRAVSTFKSDVFAAKPDERLGLKAIVEMLVSRKDEHNNVAAVVRKESRFRTVNDLKDAKACFSGYRGVGWNAVYLALKKKKNNSDRQRLDDVESISTFFKESCVLNIDPKNRSFPSNLYSLCKKDESNLTLEEKTFKCLEDGADVAFVNVSAVRAYASRKSRFSASNHTLVVEYIICALYLEHLFRQRRIQFQVEIALSPKRGQFVFSSKSHFGLGNMTHTAV
ncbi:transferrin-like isoform X1 [Nasonia vitripennis]|uniref:Transferrin-like domain-containing protein n=1 Tax=Nasonia vitripennis TaxID=7425 RepID=A0A7M7QGD5_NASVI|nr:transferrin-like isoform X1 [Nasonia vitripennis]